MYANLFEEMKVSIVLTIYIVSKWWQVLFLSYLLNSQLLWSYILEISDPDAWGMDSCFETDGCISSSYVFPLAVMTIASYRILLTHISRIIKEHSAD